MVVQVAAWKRAFGGSSSSTPQTSSPTASPKRLDLHYQLSLKLFQHCPHCGGDLDLVDDLRVVKGYSYERRDQPAPKVVQTAFSVVNDGEVEL